MIGESQEAGACDRHFVGLGSELVFVSKRSTTRPYQSGENNSSIPIVTRTTTARGLLQNKTKFIRRDDVDLRHHAENRKFPGEANLKARVAVLKSRQTRTITMGTGGGLCESVLH